MISQRICLECIHCDVDGGSPGYSEYTPGNGMTYRCTKGHDLGVEPHGHGSRSSMLRGILQAKDCVDFQEADK